VLPTFVHGAEMKIAQPMSIAALGGSLLLAAPPASAQQTIDSLGVTVTATPAVTTDYLFRGLSQTRSRPAVQFTLDVEHESGVYVGTFVSNANFVGTNIRQEADFNFGYRFAVGNLKLDIGGTYFGYPGYDKPPGGFEAAWWEATLRGSYEIAPVKIVGQIAWSPDFNFESGNAVYVEGGFDLALPEGFTLAGRAGYQWIERNFADPGRPNDGFFGARDYGVFSLALSREVVLGVIGTVTLSHATIDDNECFGGLKVCGTRVVGTLSRPF
jgi:uncharacterized protein (TIGR02001 family)